MTHKSKTSILMDADKCTGYPLCEMACSMPHHGNLSPDRSRIRVLRFEGETSNGADGVTGLRRCTLHQDVSDECPPPPGDAINFLCAVLSPYLQPALVALP